VDNNLEKGVKQHREGGVRQMIAIALPMVVSSSCDTLMVFTDRLFLSKLSPEFMNAAMGGGLTAFMMISFFLGLTGYTTALVAQYFGARRKKQCAIVAAQALIFSLLVYIPILVCRPLAHGFFKVMGITPAQLAPQILYFDILMFGVIFSLCRSSLSGFFSGVGRTRIVMIASCTAFVVNIVFNYIFVFGKFGVPAFGIAGSACGTIIGGLCGVLVLAAAYFGRKNRIEFHVMESLKFDKAVFKKLLRFGSPTGVEFFMNMLAFDAVVLAFQAYSPAAATAATIVFNWDMVSFVPLVGVEVGVMSLVGRFMGAGKPEVAHMSVMSGLKMGMMYSSVVFVFFVIFPEHLVNIFRPNVYDTVFVSAVPTAIFMVRLAALYVLVEAVLIVLIGALRGAGDTLWAMAMSVSAHWIMLAIALISFHVLKVSAETAWVFMVMLFIVLAFVVGLRYRHGAWKKIKVIHEIEPAMVGDGFHEISDL